MRENYAFRFSLFSLFYLVKICSTGWNYARRQKNGSVILLPLLILLLLHSIRFAERTGHSSLLVAETIKNEAKNNNNNNKIELKKTEVKLIRWDFFLFFFYSFSHCVCRCVHTIRFTQCICKNGNDIRAIKQTTLFHSYACLNDLIFVQFILILILILSRCC